MVLYPKKTVFWEIRSLTETFLECETMCREPPPGHVFVESLAEIDRRKVAEVVRGSRDKKNNASATHFFALSPKSVARFRWKRARLSLFRLQKFNPICQVSSKSIQVSFQIIIGEPIGDRIADNDAHLLLYETVIISSTASLLALVSRE